MQFKSNGAPVGRIVIGLRENAAYDIKAVNKGIVVRIDGAGRRVVSADQAQLTAQVSSIKAELAKEKDLLAKIRESRERDSKLRLNEEQSRLEAERLRAKAEELKKGAEAEAVAAARLAAEEKGRLEDSKKARLAEEKTRAELNGLVAKENSKLAEARKAREAEEKLVAQLADARKQQEQSKIAKIQDEIEKARLAKVAQEAEIAKLKGQVEIARQDAIKAAELTRQAERLEARVVNERAELDKVVRDRQVAAKAWSETVGKLETEEKKLQAIAVRRGMAEKEVADLRAEVDALKNNRKAVETAEARSLREQIESRESELKMMRAKADGAGEAVQAAGIRLTAKEKEIAELKSAMDNERKTLEARLAAEKQGTKAELAVREKEIALLKSEAAEARKSAARADGKMTEAQKESIARLEAREKELAAAKVAMEVASRDAEAKLQQERAQSMARVTDQENKLEALRTEMAEAKKAAEAYGRNKALAEQEKEIGSLRARYEETLADVKETNRRQEETIKDLSQKVTVARTDVDQARQAILTKEQEISDLKGALAASRKATGNNSTEVANLAAQLRNKEAALAETETSLKRHLAEVEDLAARRASQVTRLQEEVRRLQDEGRTTASAQVSDLLAQLNNREAEISVLKKAWEESRTKAGRDNDDRTSKLQKMIEEQQTATAALKSRYEQELASSGAAVKDREARIVELTAQFKALQGSSSERETREVERLRKLVSDRETELQRLKLSADADKSNGARISGELEKRQSEVTKALAALESARSDMSKAQLRENEALKKEQAAAAKVEALTAAMRDADNKLMSKQQEVDRLTGELARAKASENSVASNAKAAYSAEIDRLTSELARAKASENSVASNAKATYSAEINRLTDELARAKAAGDNAANDVKVVYTAEIDRLTDELARAKAAGDNAANDVKVVYTAEIDRLTDELAQARAAENKTARTINAASQAEIDRLSVELAQARTEAKKATKPVESAVRGIDFRNTADGPSLILSMDGDADYSITAREGTYILTLDRTKLPTELTRRLDVTAFGTSVNMVSSFVTGDGKVQIVADLNRPIGQKIARQDGKLVWTFAGPAAADMMAGASATPRLNRMAAQNAAGTPPAPAPAPLTPEMKVDPTTGSQGFLRPSMVPKKKKYQGKRINLTVKDADIQNVLTFLAREGKVNIVTSEEVKGKVTFHLEDVQWDLALDTVLKAKGLDYVVEQGIYRVASSESIQREYEAKVEKAKKQRELKPVVVRLVPVNYGKGSEMAARLKDVLSEKGTVSVDDRTNTLVIKDTEDYLQAAEDLVKRLDQQTPQILIEARIVEARTTFSEDIGIQWGGNFAMASAFGNETGAVFPSSIGLAGGASPATPNGGISLDNPNWAVNLPAAVGTGAGGAIGIQLGSIGGIGNLTLRLSAAEENGDVKIISSPRISTLDNRKASISQGVQIPISVVSAAGVNTQFFSADLKLDVEPHVTRDGHINLKLDISKNEPDFGNLAANGNPTIQKKEAHTELLIRDGDTTVIGGIYTRSTGKSFKKIPFLGDIPILGWLFKSRSRSDDRSELLIFITPKVVNREVSL
jgi:type IV pilus assembly protein PilQ